MQSLLAHAAGLSLHSEQDALDVLSSDLPACIFTLDDLHADFFDLQNGLAGGCFQKFVNYNYRVAFILPEPHTLGARVSELVSDHRTHPTIRFFNTEALALSWLEPG